MRTFRIVALRREIREAERAGEVAWRAFASSELIVTPRYRPF